MQAVLPWHRAQWERVLQLKAANRLPHALLLSGAEGVGVGYFAAQLVQALLCKMPGGAGSACGHCRDCYLYKAGHHPDFIRVEPAAAGKPIKVDQIRELCAFLEYTSERGGLKISLVAPADAMNLNAANSLLKTLEEPSPGSLLLLQSRNPFKLPATVRSRCQQLAFPIPPSAQALAWLTPQLGEADDAALLLGLAGGAPFKARNYAKQDRLALRQTLFQSYRAVVSGGSDPIQVAEQWVKQKNLEETLVWLIGWHVDMIRLKMTSRPPHLVNPDLRPMLYQLAETIPVLQLFRRLDGALQIYTLAKTQAHPQLMLEAFLSDCAV